jgi:CRISPR type IV-associated protein Csf3
MEAIKVTAFLSSPIAVCDDWTPSLDALLEWQILEKLNLLSPNPTTEQVAETRPLVFTEMPIEKGDLNGEWYWKVSSPCYAYTVDQQSRFRKRWSPGVDSPEPNWGKRKPKFTTSQGAEKAYDLPLFLRSAYAIHWYGIGDPSATLSLLESITGLGKKRSQGYGQILKWVVEPFSHDWHLWKVNTLMKAVPIEMLDPSQKVQCTLMNWGWRPPGWLAANKSFCAMPTQTVVKLDKEFDDG